MGEQAPWGVQAPRPSPAWECSRSKALSIPSGRFRGHDGAGVFPCLCYQ